MTSKKDLKPKISVITPTVREGGLELVRQALKNQTFREFEWIICSPFDPKIKEARWIKDSFQGGFWGLNRAYNALFEASQGELVVSWQDFIWAKSDALAKFWATYQATSAVVSGVGDQYSSLDEYGKPTNKIWFDPRRTTKYGSFYECKWNDAEWNFCAIPRESFYKVGGMDATLDFLGYGGDQLQTCERMNEAGVRFYLDQSNESFTLRHGRVSDWDDNHVLFNGEYDRRKEELKQQGSWPKLDNFPKKR